MMNRGAGPLMYADSMDVFLNEWFTTYEEARAAREASGGYLLPYQHHFFVTTAPAIRMLGLDPEDPDWELIGWDWAEPRDADAWARLETLRLIAISD